MGIIGKVASVIAFVLLLTGWIKTQELTTTSLALAILGYTFWVVPKQYELDLFKYLGWAIIFISCYLISQLADYLALLILGIYYLGYVLAGLPQPSSSSSDYIDSGFD